MSLKREEQLYESVSKAISPTSDKCQTGVVSLVYYHHPWHKGELGHAPG